MQVVVDLYMIVKVDFNVDIGHPLDTEHFLFGLECASAYVCDVSAGLLQQENRCILSGSSFPLMYVVVS